jgi:signal transduction histidine kinase
MTTTDRSVPPWTPVVAPTDGRARDAVDPTPRRVVTWVAVVAVVVIVVVIVAALVAARRLAETESVRDAADRADRIADVLVQPELTDALLSGDPGATAAVDAVVRDHVLSDSIVRVKIWDADGRIVWSDEPRLVGQRFGLADDELEALGGAGVDAEVSDLDAPENAYERGEGKLLETYRSVRTAEGTPLLFEVYFRYDEVLQRSGQLWQGFAGIAVGSVVVVLALLAPVLWRLLTALRSARVQREALLTRALEASADERRRIAGTLHDGVVQDLVATSLALSAEGAAARRRGDAGTADGLDTVAGSVRSGIGGLRTLLVDIYPPNLERAGLASALEDLATATRARGMATTVAISGDLRLDADAERLVHRVVQECLVNVVKHAGASAATVTVEAATASAGAPTAGRPSGQAGPRRVVVTVSDDGRGFDPVAVDHAPHGHFGLRLVTDAVRDAGAALDLATSPGHGTRWRLTVAAS